MSKITDAQIDVAKNAYDAVYAVSKAVSDGTDSETDAMRAALEAYERVRDLAAIYGKADAKTEQQERQP